MSDLSTSRSEVGRTGLSRQPARLAVGPPSESAGRRAASQAGGALAPGLTIIVLLSGPQRKAWLEEALDSVPLDSPHLSAMHIVHQGGAWDWHPALRARYEADPKVRVFEFAQRLDIVPSFNRAMGTVQSRWALILPDDDQLIIEPFRAALEQVASIGDDCGMLSFGWYEHVGGNYVRDRIRAIEIPDALRGPPLCATVFNVERLREIGGFDARVVAFCDMVMTAQLRAQFGARFSEVPVGIIRTHPNQEGRKNSNYAPFIDATCEILSPLLRDGRTVEELRTAVRGMIHGQTTIVRRLRRFAAYLLRARRQPVRVVHGPILTRRVPPL